MSQLLGGEWTMSSDSFMVEADEVVDAQPVDISIVCRALTGEILAEIVTVDADSLGELLKGQVIEQEKLCVYAVLLQQ